MTASALARRDILREEGRPLFRCAWERVVFLHYEVEPRFLQPTVPFELDLFEGRAHVSLVAFTLRDLRFAAGGPPLTTHGFLNVRTYVRDNGIYFLAEWLPNPLCVVLGPRLYGLPYRLGRLRYEHEGPVLRGRVEGAGGALEYRARVAGSARPAEGLEEHLVERYAAFTRRGPRSRVFRVWHPPWELAPLDAEIVDDRLIGSTGSWFRRARFVGAHYSAGFDGVWMGRPRRLA
jgi:hypothetical protein